MEDYFHFDIDYENYTTAENGTDDTVVDPRHSSCFKDINCFALVIVNIIMFFLGILGNGIVIWIAGLKMSKTVNTTWYLSLAVSDFMFCTIHPFNIAYMISQDWTFGLFMCKFTSFMMFVNMFSSIFLLVVISVDRSVSVIFPVLAQNQRTVNKASGVVILAWVLSLALSIPSIIFRDVQSHIGKSVCFNNYTANPYSHKSIAVSRFVFGFVIPFIVIIACYSIIMLKLRNNRMMKSSKPLKVMTALVATFFICWLPYHFFVLLELNQSHFNKDLLSFGLQIGTIMATANSFLNPVLYVFMGNDFRKKFKSSLLSKIENAMAEEGRTTSRYLSRSSSVEGRASTHI